MNQTITYGPISVDLDSAWTLLPTPRARMFEIIEEVAREHRLTSEDLRGYSRRKEIVAARHEAMRLIRNLGFSYPQIGRAFNRDHTSVIHAVERAKARAYG